MRLPVLVLAACVTLPWGRGERGVGLSGEHPIFDVVFLPAGVRDSMTLLWTRNNEHWDELADVNTLEQMLGTGKPTQHEYLGCLWGVVTRDTLWVEGWVPARNLKQLQFAVTGTCDHVAHFVGTWHTHPYRADLTGRPIKERELSDQDLATFVGARDLVTMVMWDADSLDVAAKSTDGTLRHPVPLAVH